MLVRRRPQQNAAHVLNMRTLGQKDAKFSATSQHPVQRNECATVQNEEKRATQDDLRKLKQLPHLDVLDEFSEARTLVGPHANDVHGVVEVLDVLGVELEERSELLHQVPDLGRVHPEEQHRNR